MKYGSDESKKKRQFSYNEKWEKSHKWLTAGVSSKLCLNKLVFCKVGWTEGCKSS